MICESNFGPWTVAYVRPVAPAAGDAPGLDSLFFILYIRGRSHTTTTTTTIIIILAPTCTIIMIRSIHVVTLTYRAHVSQILKHQMKSSLQARLLSRAFIESTPLKRKAWHFRTPHTQKCKKEKRKNAHGKQYRFVWVNERWQEINIVGTARNRYRLHTRSTGFTRSSNT